MVFWQLTIDANDPARLAEFWAVALGYEPAPPSQDTTYWTYYRRRLGDRERYSDRLFDPQGKGPAIWFQQVPEGKAGKNRLHVDLYPTGRDVGLTAEQRAEIIEAKVAELEALGAKRLHQGDSYVVMQDPEGNEFCVS